jgi:hypothetical protein
VRSPPGNWFAPAGSNRSGGGGNETAGAFDAKGQRVAPRAGRPQRVVNAEQAPKAVMWEPTRHTSGEGRRRWAMGTVGIDRPRERSDPAIPPGYWRRHVRRGDPKQHGKSRSVWGSGLQPDAREGQAGPAGMADGFVVPVRPGNAGGGKGPEFEEGVRRGMRAGRVAMSLLPPINGSGTPGGVPRPVASPTRKGVLPRPRAVCGKSARTVRRAGCGNGAWLG